MNPIVYCMVVSGCNDKASEDAMAYAALIALIVIGIMALIVIIDKIFGKKDDDNV